MRPTVIELAVLMVGMCTVVNVAQTLKPRPPGGTQQNADLPVGQVDRKSVDDLPIVMPLTVEAGTPIKVAIESEVRIRAVGQTIHCKTTEPVYAFDKLLVPVGTVVNGKVSAIDPVPKMTRTMQAANGNFKPVRKVHVQFDEMMMADGKTVALRTVASPAPDGVLRFVSANEAEKKKNKVQEAASNKVSATRQAIHQQWSDLQKQIHEPGKMHKVKRIVLAELPVHPQYLDAGTSFNANLLQPLNFGTETVMPGAMGDIGAPPPTGSAVHARLETALS
jgi:hypothetical protein